MKRKWMITLVTGMIGLLLIVPSLIGIRWCRGLLPEQLAAQRWGTDYVQVSCYIAQDQGVGLEQISQIRESLKQSLSEESEDTLWYDVYSSTAETVSVLGKKNGAKNVQRVLVSEQYFRIHAYPLVSGSWLSAADISTQRVVLDEEAAWKLFGSTDIVGQSLTMGNSICEVAGVIQMPENFATRAAQKESSAWLFLLYPDYAASLTQGETPPPITAYEAILPERVSGYGMSLLEKAVGVVTSGGAGEIFDGTSSEAEQDALSGHCLLVQNTGRFSLAKIWDYIFHHTDYILHQEAIPYPTSENAALLVLHRIACLALLTVLGLLLLLFSILFAVLAYRQFWKIQGKRWIRWGKGKFLIYKSHIRKRKEKHTP